MAIAVNVMALSSISGNNDKINRYLGLILCAKNWNPVFQNWMVRWMSWAVFVSRQRIQM